VRDTAAVTTAGREDERRRGRERGWNSPPVASRSPRVRATGPGARAKRYGAKFPSDSDLLSSETLEGEKVRGGTSPRKVFTFPRYISRATPNNGIRAGNSKQAIPRCVSDIQT
jgi:hypothetical protein